MLARSGTTSAVAAASGRADAGALIFFTCTPLWRQAHAMVILDEMLLGTERQSLLSQSRVLFGYRKTCGESST